MKFEYSQSVNNWFKDFPRTFKLVCGPSITELGGPWTAGSRIILAQTPLSKVHDGTYATGCHLPDYKIIYSDTGLDDDFKIKYIEYGWGSFLKSDGANYFLLVEKYCELISGYNGVTKVFQLTKTTTTQIPKTQSLYGPVNPYVPPVVIPKYDGWLEQFYKEFNNIDFGYYVNQLILAYGSFANPKIETGGWSEEDNDVFGHERPTLTIGEIELHNSLFNDWFAPGSTSSWPFLFHYANSNWWRDLDVNYAYAPDRFGIYMFFIDVSLGGQYVIGGPANYIVYTNLVHAMLITEIIWRGEDITRRLRDSMVNRPWVVPSSPPIWLG